MIPSWLLKFHPEKCKHVRIGKKSIEANYTLQGEEVPKTTTEKDIGVTIDERLDFEEHISIKVKKANSTFAIIRRSFNFLNEETFLPLYKSLVRTHLEYANTVWAPYKLKDIEKLENVQRRATKQIPGFNNLTYPERLKRLKLPTLAFRRIRGDMIEAYKFIHGIYDKNTKNIIKMWDSCTDRHSKRKNRLKIYPQQCTTNQRKHSFAVRVAKIWNNLPHEVVNAKSVNAFKNKLDRFWKNQELLYDNHRAEIKTGTGNILQWEEEEDLESGEEDPTCTRKLR